MTDRDLLREQWRAIASALEIELVAPFCLPLAGGRYHEFAVLLPQFGGERGMLIDAEHVPEAFQAALNAGYGCTSMEAETHYLPVDPRSYIACLVDWSWTVESQPPPAWYANAA